MAVRALDDGKHPARIPPVDVAVVSATDVGQTNYIGSVAVHVCLHIESIVWREGTCVYVWWKRNDFEGFHSGKVDVKDGKLVEYLRLT